MIKPLSRNYRNLGHEPSRARRPAERRPEPKREDWRGPQDEPDEEERLDEDHLGEDRRAGDGPLDRLTLGAGVTAQSNIRAISSPAGQPSNGVSNGATDVNWSGYAIWNAMAKYQLTDDTSVSLNANNLFDKHYYTRYGFYAGAIYGDPRNLSLTVSTAF